MYYLLGEDAVKLSEYMAGLQSEGSIRIDGELFARVQADFAALGVKNQQCLDTISKYDKEYGYLLDPHTACIVAAYEAFSGPDEVAISFATAHPAKFDEAIALTGIKQEFPAQISALFSMPQHQTVVEHDKAQIVRELLAFYR